MPVVADTYSDRKAVLLSLSLLLLLLLLLVLSVLSVLMMIPRSLIAMAD